MADPTIPTRAELAKAFNGDDRLIAAFEEIFYLVPDQISGEIQDLQERVNFLEPVYNTITASDSPYTAKQNEYIEADTSDGAIDIVFPLNDGGFICVYVNGPSDVTLNQTINGELNPKLYDQETLVVSKFENGWRVSS